MAKKHISEPINEGDAAAQGGRIAVDQGNIGFLTVKLLSELNVNVKKLINILEDKGK